VKCGSLPHLQEVTMMRVVLCGAALLAAGCQPGWPTEGGGSEAVIGQYAEDAGVQLAVDRAERGLGEPWQVSGRLKNTNDASAINARVRCRLFEDLTSAMAPMQAFGPVEPGAQISWTYTMMTDRPDGLLGCSVSASLAE